MTAYTPYVWPLVLATLCCGAAGLYARRFPEVPATRPFAALMWLASLWTLIYALNISVVAPGLRIFLSTCIYIPTRLIPLAILILALEYTGNERFLTKRRTILLFAVPAVAIVASLTSPFHRLFRYSFLLQVGGPVSVLHYTGGPIYWLSNTYGDIVMVAAMAVLLRALGDPALRWRNTLLLIAGLLVPVVVNVLFTYGLTPIPGYNFAPSSLILTSGAYLWALLRFQLFSMAPIARATVMDNIADLVIVFDMRGHIIDFNAAAQAACGLDSKRAIGATTRTLGSAWATFFHDCSALSSCREEASITVDGAERVYDLAISPIKDYRKRIVGRLFVLHDITALRAASLQIQQLLDEKELLLREVHHRIKNNMSVIASILSLQADTLRDSPAYDALQDAKSRVVSMMVLYDRLYRNSGDGTISIQEYFTPLLDRIVHSVGDAAAVEVRTEIRDFSIASKTLLPVGIIVNELLTNAMKHAFVGKPHGVVTLSAALSDDGTRATVLVADDGIGLPEGAEVGTSRGFGLQLVEALLKQIGGRMTVTRSSGTCFALEFAPR